MSLPILLLALIWGVIWAICLQLAPLGQYLASRRAWLTVVIGIGGDLLILLLLLPLEHWLNACAVIALSSLGIIARSLHNEWADHRAVLAQARGANPRRGP